MKMPKEFLISLVILVAAGLGLRSISHGESIPLRQSFADFPLHIEPWSGRMRELDTKVLAVLRVDDYILRHYADAQGMPLELYIGYYRSQRQGATYHSPKNCLPGAGWTFLSTGKTRIPLPLSPATAVEINQFVIQKGLDKQLVLYWYQDRGRIITSEYWAKFYMIWDAMARNRTDGSFVRITLPFSGENEAEAVERGRLFAAKLLPLLSAYLPS